MNTPSYPAAREVAKRIEQRLAADTTAFQKISDAPKPDAVAIEEIITAAFWASLRREEGRAPTISLAFVPPERSAAPMTFQPTLALEPDVLARLAPAVERPGIHLGVSWQREELRVWGATRSVPKWCFVLEVVAPGLLVVKYRRADPSIKFANVAVLEGANVKFLERQDAMGAETPTALSSLLEFYSSAGRNESENILVRLGVSMRAHRHGGSLLVVPHNSDDWRKSIVQPVTYRVLPPFSEIRTLKEGAGHIVENPLEVLRAAVDALAGLTAVDGATVISDHFDLFAFGAKIMLRDGQHSIEKILLTEPFEGAVETVVAPAQLGGTRHLSAAQFVQDQRNAIALVASQDGPFTLFAWSQSRKMVHGHRLEALLL